MHVFILYLNVCDLRFYFRFLDAYKSHGLDFWALTPQNEPFCGKIYFVAYNSMGMSTSQERDWVINNLGPTLHANGYGDLQIMIADDQRPFLPLWVCAVS
jgi:glucosylceramidase